MGTNLSMAMGGLRAPRTMKRGLLGGLVELYHKEVDGIAKVVDGILCHNEFIRDEVRATSHYGLHRLLS